MSLESLHQKALELYENKNLDEALKTYEEIINLNPADEVALSCIMDIYLEKDDKLNYYIARANVNIAQGKLEYAIKDTKKALELDVDNINVRRKLARLYKIDNKNLKSIDEFIKLLELSPAELDVYFDLVDLYMKENSPESAISTGKKGLEHFPDDIALRNMMAQIYFKVNDYKSALEVAYDEMLKVKILLQDNQNELANEILSKFNINQLEIPQRKNYHVLKAQYLYNTEKYSESIEEINEYVKIASPDAVSFQMKALNYEAMNDEFNAHLNWGFCFKLQGKFDDALVEFDHAYQKNKDNKTVLIELAKIYQKNKEKYVAMEYWEKVYAIDKDEEAKEILAEFYYSEGNFDKAQEFGKEISKKEVQEEEYTGFLDKIMAFFSKK